jgi:hypothetical protein
MNSGDNLGVDIHDGPAGLTAIIHDQTTGKTGSMTASAANGFAQILYEPTSSSCHQAPYTFRPMYSTASEHTRVPWAAHTYNVAFSDEIGHFEECSAVTGEGGAIANNEGTLDDDDTGCFSAAVSCSCRSGCIATDNDFDGPRISRYGRGRIEPRAGQEVPPEFDHVLSPVLMGLATTASHRGRPAADPGGGLRRELQRVHGRELREPSAWVELLPDLLDRTSTRPERPLRLATRRNVHQGHNQHVQRELGCGVRATALPSTRPESGDPAPDELRGVLNTNPVRLGEPGNRCEGRRRGAIHRLTRRPAPVKPLASKGCLTHARPTVDPGRSNQRARCQTRRAAVRRQAVASGGRKGHRHERSLDEKASLLLLVLVGALAFVPLGSSSSGTSSECSVGTAARALRYAQR